MNEARRDRPSRWRWIWAFLFVFSAHAALVFWFGERTRPVDTLTSPAPLLYVATEGGALQQLASLAPTTDPTLFALPNPRGFSGEAWLNFVPMEVTLSNWTAAPSWLPIPTNELGSALTFLAKSNAVRQDVLAQQLRPVTPFEVRTPANPILTASTFRVEGPAAKRFQPSGRSIPVATNLDLLGNSIVDVGVRGDGVVETAMLSGASGLNAADEAALEAAKRLEFEPLPMDRKERERAGLARARVVFTWQIVAPNPTNSLAAAAP